VAKKVQRRLAAILAAGFQYRADAHRFLAELKQRLGAFALAVHPDKTRIIEFGRFANENRRSEVRASLKPSPFWGSPTSAGELGKAGG
jgi:hypothetical protein